MSSTRRKVGLTLVASLVAIVVLIVMATLWVFQTQSGARFALGTAQQFMPFELEIEQINGSLADQLDLAGIEFSNDQYKLSVKQLSVRSALLKLFQRVVTIESLTADGIEVTLVPPPTTKTPSSKPFQLPESIDLPVDIIIQTARFKNISVVQPEQEARLPIDEISFSSRWQERQLAVSSLTIKSPVAEIQANGTVVLERPYKTDAQLRSFLTIGDYAGIESTLEVGGDLADFTFKFEAGAPYNLSTAGTVADLLTEPSVSLSLEAAITSLFALNAQWPDLPLGALVAVEGPLQQLTTSGAVNTKVADVGSVVLKFSGQLLSDSLPKQLVLNNATINLPDSDLKTQMTASGSIDNLGTQPLLNLLVSWKQLGWPLRGDTTIASPSGKARITGALDDYRVEVDGEVTTTENLEGSAQMTIVGDSKQLKINPLQINTLGGTVSGKIDVNLIDNVSFSTQLQGVQLNPAGLDADWPGKLDVTMVATGAQTGSSLRLAIDNFAASGTLRGQQITAKARGNIENNQVELQQFSLISGSTEITAAGIVKDDLDLTWSIKSDDLQTLAPMLKGKLIGQGKASGSKVKPTFTVDVKGENLAYHETVIGGFSMEGYYSPPEPQRSVIEIKATELMLGGSHAVEALSLKSVGLVTEHVVSMQLKDAFGDINAKVGGGLQEDDRYTFQLQQLEVQPENLGVWQLSSQSQGEFQNNNLKLSATCVEQSVSKLCVTLETSDTDKSIVASIVELPIALFARFLPAAVEIDGILNGGGELTMVGTNPVVGRVQINSRPFSVQSNYTKDSSESHISFGDSEIRLEFQPSGLIELNATVPLTTQGGVLANAKIIPDSQSLKERSLTGKLELQLPSLAFVSDYIPQLSEVAGRFDGAIDLGGTVDAPSLIGGFELLGGAALLNEPGIRINELKLSVKGDQSSQLKVNASAKSGEGTLAVDGDIQFGLQQNVGSFSVTGNDFQVFGTPQIDLRVSPDLKVKWQDKKLVIDGKIIVPKATIDLEDLPETAIQASKDQILIDQQTKQATMLLPVEAKIQIELKDDVRFSGYGLQAKLGGKITLSEKTGSPTTAVGEINLVDGEYEAYGQQLKIATGRLLFTGGPIEAPGIDLRAIRNPTPDLEVGITVRGPLKRPEFSIFSTPRLPDSERLAYLIFGRPLNSDAAAENTIVSRATLALAMQGGDLVTKKLADGLGLDQLTLESSDNSDLSQVSLVIGKYLSPKLFVSYGIGLLEPVSTLKLEYALSSKWRLISESSSLESGVDVQYVIER